MSKKHKLSITFVLVALTTLAVNAGPSEIEKSGESTIDFVKIEATLAPNIIHFKWFVNSEQQGNYFLIEKSMDEISWSIVTRIKSIENHHELHTYLTSEINLSQGASEYFRITRVDQVDVKSILETINVSQPILSNLFVIPVSKKINNEIITAWNSMLCSDGTVNIYDENGTCVRQKRVRQKEGYNRFILNIKSLNKGKYTLILKDEFGNTITKTFSKGEKTGRTKF